MKVGLMKTRQGFTIVELLIVIVIIAILAAITVVAFNGIKNRATLSSLQSEWSSSSKKVMLFAADNSGDAPLAVDDCPTPGTGNICLTSNGNTIYYASVATSGYGYKPIGNRSYALGVFGATQGYLKSPVTFVGSNEFLRTIDLAPLIDKYGLVKYQLSFDISSANIATKNTVNVYMQNGSGSKYSFSVHVPVTTATQHQVLTFTPTLNNASQTQSYLAFYGNYGTGNVPTVSNIEIQLAK